MRSGIEEIHVHAFMVVLGGSHFVQTVRKCSLSGRYTSEYTWVSLHGQGIGQLLATSKLKAATVFKY